VALPWFRFDTNFPQHDKTLELVDLGDKGRAAGFVYVCALAYCQTNETDGVIPFGALPFIHATRKHAQLLVDVGMWAPHPKGWEVVNYLKRQPSAETIEAGRAARSLAGRKGNCVRWHVQPCDCWETGDESRVVMRSPPPSQRGLLNGSHVRSRVRSESDRT
jgi:hypothetical protein